jgi:hypothetical protein
MNRARHFDFATRTPSAGFARAFNVSFGLASGGEAVLRLSPLALP